MTTCWSCAPYRNWDWQVYASATLPAMPDIIEQLNKIRLPYNINSLTQISADFALSNKALFDQQTQKICAERSIVFKRLNALDGITAYPSAANFILFQNTRKSGKRNLRIDKTTRRFN